MSGVLFPDQLLFWDPSAEQGTTGPCSAEVVRATLPYQRGTIRQDSSLHSFLLNIGLVTVNALGHYKDAMEPQGVLVLITERDRIVLHYWQDLEDCVGNCVAAFSALRPPVAVSSGTDEAVTAEEELPGASPTPLKSRLKASAKPASGPPTKAVLQAENSALEDEYAKFRKEFELLRQQKGMSPIQ